MKYDLRMKGLRQALSEKGADGMLVCKKENQKYLSGFHSTEYYVVIKETEGFLLTDSRYFEAAEKNQVGLTPVLLNRENTIFQFLEKSGIKTLALEMDFVTHKFFLDISKALPQASLVDGAGLIERLRIVKDETEISKIRKAESIGDEAFSHLLKFIQAGVTERELALELEFQMKRLGASALSFETICASGERSSLPHGTATDRRIQHGDLITFDFGCVYEEYCSDMTRTVGISHLTKEMEQVYGVVLEAQEKALAEICQGKTGAEIDSIARNVIKYHGYGSYFGHGLGHGVGLEIHEEPRLSPGGDKPLEENMAVTVEPGIYLPGRFGVRIEDLVIVKKEGCENLSSSNKKLMIINGG